MKYAKESFNEAHNAEKYFPETEDNHKNFLANYQLLLVGDNNPAGPETVDWNDIWQVSKRSNTSVSCPICLNEPSQMVAPQITSCGHIFCWPCIIQHLSYEKNGLKCPLCNEVVTRKELKTVVDIGGQMYQKGTPITMKHLFMVKPSNIVRNPEDGAENHVYRCIQHAIIEEVESALKTERDQVTSYIHECESSKELEGLSFAVETLKSLEERELLALKITAGWGRGPNSKRRPVQAVPHHHQRPLESFQTQASDVISFYQEDTGRHLFLHPNDVKYLTMEYQSFNHFPAELNSIITSTESMTVTSKIKKRYKFLEHVPENAEIELIRIDLTPYLSSKTLELYIEETKPKQAYSEEEEYKEGGGDISPTKLGKGMSSTLDTRGKNKDYGRSVIPADEPDDHQHYEIAITYKTKKPRKQSRGHQQDEESSNK